MTGNQITSSPAFAAVLLAAGRGARMRSQVPKCWLPLGGIPLVLRSAQRLARLEGLVETVLVVHEDDFESRMPPFEAALRQARVARIVAGGETRQESVRRGLVATGTGTDLVLIHDAARPFFPLPAADAALELAARHGGAILGLPARDTLKEVEGGLVRRTIPRAAVWQAQTPQVFRRSVLLAAMEGAAAEGFLGTDDASVVERFGGAVAVVPGSPLNLKITTPEDLEVAGLILALVEAAP